MMYMCHDAYWKCEACKTLHNLGETTHSMCGATCTIALSDLPCLPCNKSVSEIITVDKGCRRCQTQRIIIMMTAYWIGFRMFHLGHCCCEFILYTWVHCGWSKFAGSTTAAPPKIINFLYPQSRDQYICCWGAANRPNECKYTKWTVQTSIYEYSLQVYSRCSFCLTIHLYFVPDSIYLRNTLGKP